MHYRPRIAIGTFATTAEVEAMIGRLMALGITRYAVVTRPSQRAPYDLAARQELSGASPSQGTSGLQAIRIQLITPEQEQVVAAALLASAAKSVQLHDIDDVN